MRKTAIVLVMMLLPLASFSQTSGDVQIFASGGLSLPLSSNDCSKYYTVNSRLSNITLPSFKYSKTWTTGFHFGFGLGYTIAPDLSTILDLNYNSSVLDKTAFLKDLGLRGNEYMNEVTLKMVSINANLKYVFAQPDLFFDPYVTAGAGYMGIAADELSIVATSSSIIAAQFKAQNALNTSVGVGVDIRSTESSSLFLELKYDVSYTRSASPFSSGNFSILPIRAGVRGTF
jgi:outer membrane protein W